MDQSTTPNGFEVMKTLKPVNTPRIFGGIGRKRGRRLGAVARSLMAVTLRGDCAQFGVYKGETARLIAGFMYGRRKLHLFDSFEGLPEAWTGDYAKGHFDVGGRLPDLDPAVTRIHKGWFKDTVPPFAATLKEPLAYIHMDCDLYSSTMEALVPLNDWIAPGTIILFDEYVFQGSEDEHRALLDWAAQFNRTFDYLWRSRWVQVAVRITN